MMFLKKTIIIVLFILLIPTIVQADLVSTLRSTSLCSYTLQIHRNQILGNNNSDSGQIDCLTLQGYLSVIDSSTSYRSFQQARALVNAQHIINILAKQYGHNHQDISKLQNTLNITFKDNFNALKQLAGLSILRKFNKPLNNNEQIFFFGVQKVENGLSIVEGRKTANQAHFVYHIIKPRNFNKTNIYAPLTFRVDNKYYGLNELRQIPLGDWHGFYIKDMSIVIPIPNESTHAYLSMLGEELVFMLDISRYDIPTSATTSLN